MVASLVLDGRAVPNEGLRQTDHGYWPGGPRLPASDTGTYRYQCSKEFNP
jgi:hypothetical protein